MKLNRQIACAALLAATTFPAWALQLGQIQVKSALNQPLVAAIPLHPKNLTELDGLSVALAPAQDFARAGLQLTPTSQSLRFHVVTDNNGQKLILVTSSTPITDPYLDFLVQVNTREGKQVREFVVLLNPVIAAPAPAVQAAPVAAAPAAAEQPAELPPASAFAQPSPPPASSAPQPAQPTQAAQPTQPAQPAPAPPPARQAWPMPAPQPAPAPPPPAPPAQPAPLAQPLPAQPASTATAPAAGESIPIKHGDTLYHIASEATRGTDVSINQMMVAMLAANPDAFNKDNVNGLRAGAILRIPTRDEIDRTSLARADTEVRRQYEAWQAVKPKPATMVAGAAAEAAANATAAPASAPATSAHLALVPPTGEGGSGASRTGVAGGTSTDTVAGLKQQLQDDRSTLASLDQSNADLDSRVRSLKDIAGKSDKLLSLKDATVAELQRKLAEVQAGKAAVGSTQLASAASASSPATSPAASTAVASAPVASASASANAAAKAVATKPGAVPTSASTLLQRPLAWIVAGVVVLVLILLGLLLRRRGSSDSESARGPLPDPADIVRGTAAPLDDEEAALHEDLADHPNDPDKHLALCRHYYARRDAAGFLSAAEVMHEAGVDPDSVAWREVQVMGRELLPHNPLFATANAPAEDPYGIEAMRRSSPATAAQADDATVVAPVVRKAPVGPVARVSRAGEAPVETGPLEGDSADTKLDLARAYIDMGDPAGARTMLEEVLREGSQMQQDEARRLLAEVAG